MVLPIRLLRAEDVSAVLQMVPLADRRVFDSRTHAYEPPLKPGEDPHACSPELVTAYKRLTGQIG